MQIIYQVYYKDYYRKETFFLGTYIDYWKEIDYKRGREKAVGMFGGLVRDPNSIFVLPEGKSGKVKILTK